MKLREKEQLKKLPDTELSKKLNEFRDKLWQLKADLVRGKVKNIQEIREVKKNIARIITIKKSHERKNKKKIKAIKRRCCFG